MRNTRLTPAERENDQHQGPPGWEPVHPHRAGIDTGAGGQADEIGSLPQSGERAHFERVAINDRITPTERGSVESLSRVPRSVHSRKAGRRISTKIEIAHDGFTPAEARKDLPDKETGLYNGPLPQSGNDFADGNGARASQGSPPQSEEGG